MARLDLADPQSIEAFAATIYQKYGRLDVLVNNAGIAFKAEDPTPFAVQTEPTLRVNFWGTVDPYPEHPPFSFNMTECG